MNYKSKTRKRGKVGKLVKGRKYSNLRKYSKKRRGTYKYRNKTQNLRKKIISITRKRNGRKMYGGEGECDNAVQRAEAAIATFPNGFNSFVDILENCPTVITSVEDKYKQKIELKHHEGKPTGYISLLGLKFINYLNARITKLRIQRDKLIKLDARDNDERLNDIIQKIENLKTAISLMDQVAAAPGVGEGQLQTVRSNVDKKYYDCYVKLYTELADKLELEKRNIPLSTSLCYFSQNCDSDSDECDDCCIPDNLDFPKRQNNTTADQHDVEEPTIKRRRV